ncbi:MAG: hypothetical protein ABJF01_04705 [bacterium]
MRSSRAARLALTLLFTSAATVSAQVIDLTVHDVGLAIGDKPHVTGVRINYRDGSLRKVNGMNITIWSPYEPVTGVVNGFAIGLPVTGAGTINGLGAAVFGIGAEHSITGLGLGGIGVGGGGELRGIMLGGIGVGAGGGMTGLTVGGIGVGSGGAVRGIQIGGIGVGGGGSLSGISIGGIGIGGGGSITGLSVGGIGVGGGGSIRGITLGGIGVGAGGDVTGITIGGIGVGSGGAITGLSIGGVGVGAPMIKGLAISAIGVGAQDAHAIVLTGAYFKIEKRGRFDGASVSAVSNIQGAQHGLAIGLFNYARELHGAQLGLINVSDNDGRRRVLPVLSVR